MLGWIKQLLGSPNADMPVASSTSLPVRDAWESPEGEHDRFPFVGEFEFDYVDREGQRSHRRVEARFMLLLGDDVYLYGQCSARKANRTFYAARMANLTDARTGEAFADATEGLLTCWKATPEGAAVQLAREHDEELVILLMLGRAAGRLQSKTSAAIVDWLSGLSSGQSPDLKILRSLVVGRSEPTQTDWRSALKFLGQQDAARREGLLRAMHGLPSTKQKSAVRDALTAEVIGALGPSAA